MKLFAIPTPATHAFARTVLLAALTGVTLNAAGPVRSRSASPKGVPAPVPAIQSAGGITQTVICIQPNGAKRIITVPAGQSPNMICPPPIPDNVAVDTNSDQTIYGSKAFARTITGDINGNAATADYFTGQLLGDITGTQQDAHVVNVSASALPSIGFGITPGAAKIKYVDGDADAGDPRMDGSLAHPFQTLNQAAASVQNGDRLVLHGNLWGYAVFAQGVTLEGASDHQTVIYGSLVFNGFLASTVRNLRVNCTSDTACITNSTTGGADLVFDHVIVSQSYTGPAAEAINGSLIAYASKFGATDGAAVRVGNTSGAPNRFTDCDFTSANGSALEITNTASAEVNGSRLVVTGDQPAIVASGATSVRVLQSSVTALGTAILFKDSYNALVTGSWLTSGGGDSVVSFNNTPRQTFAVSTDRRMIVGNYFRTGGVSAIGCVQSDELYSQGNIILDQAVAATPPVASATSRIGRPIIIPPPPPIQPVCTLLSMAAF